LADVTAPSAISTVAIDPSIIAAELTVFAPAIDAAIPRAGIAVKMAPTSTPTNFFCIKFSPYFVLCGSMTAHLIIKLQTVFHSPSTLIKRVENNPSAATIALFPLKDHIKKQCSFYGALFSLSSAFLICLNNKYVIMRRQRWERFFGY
jgi:hypothetical protein